MPAFEVYEESKHANIFHSKERDWNWERVPWRVGVDFRAPTCATCHSSLVTAPEGDIIAPRTHDFGARLWVRLFGLPYTHPAAPERRHIAHPQPGRPALAHLVRR